MRTSRDAREVLARSRRTRLDRRRVRTRRRTWLAAAVALALLVVADLVLTRALG